jgi:hypothetical protein
MLLVAAWITARPSAEQTSPAIAPPPGCSVANSAGLRPSAGSPVFLSLQREIAALRRGHDASKALQAALVAGAGTSRAQNGESDTRRQMVQVMTGMDKSRDSYACAASIAAAAGGDDAVGDALRASVAPLLQRMAAQVARLENSVVMTTSGGSGEAPAAILEERRQTGSDLLDAVANTEAAAVDGDVLRTSCAERTRLVAQLGGWSHSGSDEFTAAAGLMHEFLRKVERCGPP